jgi:D-3-phosphoglycerate dehydrogenase
MSRNVQVVIIDSNFASDAPERALIELAGGTLQRFNCRTEREVLEAGMNADIVLVQFAPVTSAVLDGWKRCRLIVRYGIGYDNIDITHAKRLNIPVCNVPFYCLDEVADHTSSLILACSRKLFELHEAVKQGKWNVESIVRPMHRSSKQVIGLIGYGRIGRKVSERLRAFSFRIQVYDPSVTLEDNKHVEQIESLDELLVASDIVSLHAPLLPETKHLINLKTLSRMKSTSFLVNTSRGGLVDTQALAIALSDGVIAGAALDVFEEEPLSVNHPLLACRNIILSPHAAYYSEQSLIDLQMQTAQEAVRWIRNEPLRSQVNR